MFKCNICFVFVGTCSEHFFLSVGPALKLAFVFSINSVFGVFMHFDDTQLQSVCYEGIRLEPAGETAGGQRWERLLVRGKITSTPLVAYTFNSCGHAWHEYIPYTRHGKLDWRVARDSDRSRRDWTHYELQQAFEVTDVRSLTSKALTKSKLKQRSHRLFFCPPERASEMSSSSFAVGLSMDMLPSPPESVWMRRLPPPVRRAWHMARMDRR